MGICKRVSKRMVKEIKLPILPPNDVGRSYPLFEAHRGRLEKTDNFEEMDIWISEDWDFCEKAREIGVKCYLDARIQLKHQATRIMTFDDINDYQTKLQKEKASPTES